MVVGTSVSTAATWSLRLSHPSSCKKEKARKGGGRAGVLRRPCIGAAN